MLMYWMQKNRLRAWKIGIESKGLRVNVHCSRVILSRADGEHVIEKEEICRTVAVVPRVPPL